jgi:uncharacterized protein
LIVLGVLRMEWRNLLFASWPMEPRVVADRLPEGLIVDVHEHQAWISVVAFQNVGIRPRGVPKPLGVTLPEVNVRTYVTHAKGPGIFFFSLDAPGPLSVTGGRLAFQLPYFLARARFKEEAGRFRIESERMHPGAPSAVLAATYRPGGPERGTTPGSLDRFLLDRYRLYTRGPLGGLHRVEVEHEPWTYTDVEGTISANTMLEAAGFETPQAPPVLHFAPGREVLASPLLVTRDG